MQKERGRYSETKQIICMKPVRRGRIARPSKAVLLGLFNFPFIFQTMVSYRVGRVKATFKYDPCAVSRMKGASPELSASSLGKESTFLPSPGSFPGILRIPSTAHRGTHAFQVHLPLAVQTWCRWVKLGSLQAALCATAFAKIPSLPSQGPIVTTCTPSVLFATLRNGRLPGIVSLTPPIIMQVII